MIKQADQIGASLLGRVEPRMAGTSFSSADRGGYDADFSNRLLQNLINRGIKVLDKTIDAELENEMIKGATQAMAGVAEENLETSILTKNFTVAGHRNMTAKMHHQSWQAQIVDEIAKGEHNDLSPTEFGAYLNQSMQEVLNDVNGMSMDAKTSMLETMLTGNQSLIAHQTKHRAQSIVDSSMGLYSMQANNLLEQAKINQGTPLEGAVIQQIQALMRSMEADNNLTPEIRTKFYAEFSEGSAKLGLANVTHALKNTALATREDGSYKYLMDDLDLGSFIKVSTAEKKARENNRILNNAQGVVEFTALREQVRENTFAGTAEDLLGILNHSIVTGGTNDSEARALLREYFKNEYTNDNKYRLANGYATNNLALLQQTGNTYAQGREAWIKTLAEEGLTLSEQLTRANDLFKSGNGDAGIAEWVGSDILKPILSEVINSDGDLSTENGMMFNQVMQDVISLDESKQSLYLSNLMLSLSPLESSFITRFLGAQQNEGADPVTAIAIARSNHEQALKASDLDRAKAVKESNKAIGSALDYYSDPSVMSNLLWNRNWGQLWNPEDRAKAKIGTMPLWGTQEGVVMKQRFEELRSSLELDLKNQISKSGRPLSKEELQPFLSKAVMERTAGTSDNLLLFTGEERFNSMFAEVMTPELGKQQDEVVDYVLKNLSAMDGYYNVDRNYFYKGGVLTVNLVNKDGQTLTKHYTKNEYLPMVDRYKEARYNDLPIGKEEILKQFEASLARTDTPFGNDTYRFTVNGYDNAYAKYSPQFMDSLYKDIISQEGMTTERYADGDGGRYSIAMGVNSINSNNPEYKKYFTKEAMNKGLTKFEAIELTEIAVKDHLAQTARAINKTLGNKYLGVSEDFEKGIFSLGYTGVGNVSPKILKAVADGDVESLVEGLQETAFFRLTVKKDPKHRRYQYVLNHLIGAMDDFRNAGIR